MKPNECKFRHSDRARWNTASWKPITIKCDKEIQQKLNLGIMYIPSTYDYEQITLDESTRQHCTKIVLVVEHYRVIGLTRYVFRETLRIPPSRNIWKMSAG